MTANDFRTLALELDGAVEGAHMGHPDFRVGGHVFASLGPGEAHGVVMVTPDVQAELIDAASEMFSEGPGAWGRQGVTYVELKPARRPQVRLALRAAWETRIAKNGKARKRGTK